MGYLGLNRGNTWHRKLMYKIIVNRHMIKGKLIPVINDASCSALLYIMATRRGICRLSQLNEKAGLGVVE